MPVDAVATRDASADPMSAGSALSPTALLLLRSEVPHLHSASTRSKSSGAPQPDATQQPPPHAATAARPPVPVDASESREREKKLEEEDEDEPASPTSAAAVDGFFSRRSERFSPADVAARTFPPLPGRAESMSVLAAGASSQLRISATHTDDLAMKAILSPPHLRATSSTGKLADAKAAFTALEVTGTTLFEQGAKLLFRGSASSAPAPAALAAIKASADVGGATKPSASGSIVEEDLAQLQNNVLVSHPTLPPPPFANMFACDNCREDIGTLLSKGRHHCRNCGGSFCADCSSRAAVVPFQVYLARGEQRVCDGCYHRIKDFQRQAQSTQVTWSGLQPPPSDAFTAAFELPASEVPVTTYNCSLFLDFSPFYGHLFLTREHACFQGYTGHKIKIPFAKIVSLLKPQFYYINALQVKTRRREKFFFAEFNGLRDLCFLRLDQLIRAYQEGRKHCVAGHPDDVAQQPLVRRRSYKQPASAAAASGPKSSSFMSSARKRDVDNFLSGASTVGYLDVDDDESDGNADADADADDDDGASSSSSRSRRSVSPDDDDDNDKKSSTSDEEVFALLPPDAPLAKTTLLLDCELNADVKDVFDLLWNDGVGQDFLFGTMERARDIDIAVGAWEAVTSANAGDVNRGFVVSKEGGFTLHRAVHSQHPPRIAFPGLPAYAVCDRVQRFRLDATSADGARWDRFVISDLHRMARIPFCDYFEIETRWVFSRDGTRYCRAQAGLTVNFLKSTWFKSQIESSTRTESKEVLESWAKAAVEHLLAHQHLEGDGSGSAATRSAAVRAATTPSCSSTDTSLSEVSSCGRDDDARGDPTPTTVASAGPRPSRQQAVAAGCVVSPAVVGGGGVAASLRQLDEARSSPVVQLLVVLALVSCLVLIRFQQMQLQQLTTTTNILLERLLLQQQLSASRAASGELAIHQICQERVVEGAAEALRQFFEGPVGP
ncbi:hypothetical protein PybrP1_003125 [[Pythium] brassicae (nom. inval.)]|nr:hypothetical protein PybrP1_003125 [[Pythium] brassicae (nom. inval.)]